MLKEKFGKLNKKKWIILALVITSIIILLAMGKQTNKFNIKAIANRFVDYQYYDGASVFVIHTKFLDEKNAVLSPTVVRTQKADNLSYDIEIPQIDGYTSNVQELKGYFDEAGLEELKNLDFVKIVEKDNVYNIYITISYTPIPGSYKIEYYEQKTSLDGYEKIEEEIVGLENGEYTGEVVTGENVTISPKEKVGFNVNLDLTELTGNVEANGTKIFKVYYDRNSYYFYTYNTGDTNNEPIEMKYGQNLDEVEDPIYSGYTFTGWKYFETLDGEEIERPKVMPANDLYAEAQWSAGKANYSLSFYTENANDTSYTNIGTYTATAISGENLNQINLAEVIENGFADIMGDNAKYYHYNEERTKENNNDFDIEIEGSGVTIVPIYFDRNLYNIEFDFNDSGYTTKAEIEINGSTYTSSYSFQAKFNQDITNLWLNAEQFTEFPTNDGTTMYFKCWVPSWSSTKFSSMRVTLTSDMINDTEDGSTQSFSAEYTNKTDTRVLIYMVESLDQETQKESETRMLYQGKYYDLAENYKQTVYSTINTWSAKELSGLTNVGKSSNGNKYYFYYDRNIYNITLYNMNNVYLEKQLKYGQSIEELANFELEPEDFTLETPGTKSWIFEGWYQDSNFMIPMTWTNADGSYKTVTETFVLYANWIPPTYTVTFNTNGGTWTDTNQDYIKVNNNTYKLIVEEGESLRRPQNPTMKGYTSQGWYYEVGENSLEYLFSDSQKVYSDLNLTINFEANQNISYKVRYIEAQFDEDGELIEDISKYTNIVDIISPKEVHKNIYGSTVTEYAVDLNENENDIYIVNTDKQEFVLESENIEDNVIYFIYSKNPELDYTIYHVKYREDANKNAIKYERGEIPTEKNILKTETGKVSALTFKGNAEEIEGWSIIGEEEQELELVLNEKLNTMYFYYNENEKGEYVVNFYFAGEDGTYPTDPTYVYEAEASAGTIIYAKNFNNFTWKNGATEEDYIGKVLDEDRCGNTCLVVTTTDETSAMNIYYKQRSDLSYIVKYLDENGVSLLEDKVVNKQIYLSSITETAPDIDGYKLAIGEEAEKTITIGLTGNIITFNYEKESNLSYSVKYIEKGTEAVLLEEKLQGGKVFKEEVTETAPSIDGYRALEEEKTIIIGTGLNEIVFEYEKRTDLTYRVEYYYNDVINNSYTVNYTNQTFNTEITEYIPKLEDGYRLKEEENLPLIIGTGDNVIKVYYESDPDQTKQLQYTVEYYKDGNFVESEPHTELVQLLEPDVLKVQKDRINISNRYEGYYLKSTEPEILPETIGANETIKVYYDIKTDLTCTIKYIDKDTKAQIKTAETKEDLTYNTEFTALAPSIEGYNVVENEKKITVKDGQNEIIFEYTKRNDLSYTIKYLDDKTFEEVKPADVIENQTFKSKVTETAPDIKGFFKTNLEETITIKVEGNEIIFYYDRIEGLAYTVNYYISGTEEKLAETKIVYENAFGDKITENAIDIEGYYVEEPATQEITIAMEEEENVINFYYTIRKDLSYKVEYYFNNELKEELTDTFHDLTFKTEINAYTDKVEYGYKLGKTENFPLKVGVDENKNVIKVYYVIDENQRKDLKYTIEYYKDGELAESGEVKANVQVLQPDTLKVDKSKINTENKYIGYYFIKTEPEEIPEDIMTESVIKIYYEIRKDLSYTIKCIDAVTGNTLKEEVKENQTYNSEITEIAPKIDGFVSLNEQETIIIGVEINEIIFEYTDKTDLKYKVEYYFNNELREVDDFEGLIFRTVINAYEDKLEKGYKLEKEENFPLTIGVDEEQNVIRVYYVTDPTQKKTLKYTVEYYKDGTLAKQEPVTKTVQWLEPDTMVVDKEKISLDKLKSKFDGYYFVNTEPEVIPDVVTTGDVIKANYTIRKDLSYTVKYINIEANNEEMLPTKVVENQTFNERITEVAPEILGFLPKQEKITKKITTGVNEFIFEYEVARNLPYTVNYYEEGTTKKATASKEVWGNTYADVVTETAIDIDGYNKVGPTTQEITIQMKDNVINFYYTKRTDLKYRVEHYDVDGKLQEEKTEYFENQTFKTKITKFTDKSDYGYKVGSTENLPLEITTNEEANVIKVHYVIDENQRKNLKYTVEYYKDGVFAEKEEFTNNVQVLQPDTMEVQKDAINMIDRFVGYYFVNTEPEVIPDIVTTGDVIKVNYTVRKDLEYKINFIDAVTGLTLREPETVKNQTYNEKVIVEPPVVDGYVPIEEPKEIVIDVETVEVSFEYTNRTDLTYKVEYYFNDVLDEEKTDTFKDLTFKTQINAFTDKVEKGYMLGRADNLPLTIGIDEEQNVIRVYYVTDPSQKKTLQYNVEYYKDGSLAKTEPVTKIVQWLEPDTMEVDKEKITQEKLETKFDGYYFVNTEPEVIPDVVTTGDVIKANYTIRKDLSYTVKYINIETGEVLFPEETVGEQTFNTKVTREAPEVEGLAPKKAKITITIKTTPNEIVFEYETARNLPYTVNYYEEGSVRKATQSKEVWGNTYNDVVTETAIDIDGYNKVEPTTQEITIKMKNNVINFYYTKRTDLKYRVEHYDVDGKLQEEKTEYFENQTFKTKITKYTDKSDYGYKVGSTENLPLEISTDEEANVIKVHYVIDENQRKDLKYTVEYYKDGEFAEKEEFTNNVQVLEPETMDVDKTAINVTDKYIGYYFANTEPEVIPDVVTNGDVIKVNYTVRKDLEYKINFIDAVTGQALKEPEIVKNQTYNEKVTVEPPVVDGYVPIEEPKEIVIDIETQEVSFEYTNRTDLTYKVEYYFNEVLDEEKTDTFKDLTFKTQINAFEDKVEKGYMFEKVDNMPLTIGIDEEQNIIKVYYVTDPKQTKQLQYTVEYYKDGTLAKTEPVTKTVQWLEPDTMVVDKENLAIEKLESKFDGYYFVKTEPEVIPEIVTTGDVIKVNYTIRKDLTYTVKYINIEANNEEMLPTKVVENQTFNEKITEEAPEIEGYLPKKAKITKAITTGVNEFIFEYEVARNLPYTVNYYEEGSVRKATQSKEVWGNTYNDVVTETAIDIDGYNKVEPTTKEITIKMKDNVINFYYTKRTDLKYRVEHYVDGVLQEEKTDKYENQTFKTKITKFTDKSDYGYKVGSTENLPLEISTNEEANVIKVHYVIDEDQRKDLKYTVEYYKDGEFAEKEEFTNNVQVLEPDTMEVDKEKINTTDKYIGYNFVNTDPEVIPDTVTNGDVIKVNYTVRKDLEYKINFIDAVTGQALKEPEIIGGQTYNSTVTVEPPVVEGYTPLESAKEIVIGLETVEVSFEYTNRTDLTYKVEYYFNGVLDEEKTDIFKGLTFKSEISGFTDKVEKGYMFEKSEPSKLIIGLNEENNVIKVYYVTDETQRKDLKYTVEYYKDGTLAKTEPVSESVQWLQADTMKVQKDKINTTDKFDGYNFVNTEPEVIPDVVTNGDVIKVNYTIRKDLSYTVKYIDAETKKELLPEKTVENQTFNEKITEEALEIDGYLPKKANMSITITTGINEIVFEYEIAQNLSYTVNYYEKGTTNKVAESKTIERKTYGEIVEETAIDVDGYNKVEPTTKELTIKMKENEINFYYTKRTDLKYTVEHYVDGSLKETETFENQTFKTIITKHNDKSGYGYKVGSTENLPLEITTNKEANVIKVHYVIDEEQRKDLKYTVEYYKDGEFAEKEEFTKNVQVLELDTMEVDKTAINVTDKYEGYYFANTEPEVIPDVVTNGDVIKVNYTIRKDLEYKINFIDAVTGQALKEPEIVGGQTYNSTVTVEPPVVDGHIPLENAKEITIGLTNNEVTFEYTTRNDLSYTVEYYFNNKLDEEKTEIVGNQLYKSKITEYEDKVEVGYKLEKTENLPLIIDIDETKNIIKVYYVTDEEQRKDLKYTVEYYKDGELAEKEEFTKEAQVLEPDTIEVDKEKINTKDKYVGYNFVNTDPEVIPEIVTTGDVIKVNYTVRKDLSYTVKYIDQVTKEELKPEEKVENQTYNEKITLKAPEIDGYIAVEEEKQIVINLENNEMIFEYKIRNDISYKVEYYFDNELNEEKTETIENQVYKSEITTYTNKVATGYKLEKTENLPLTISANEEDNIIKVYYEIDEEQRKDLKYTVEYYKDGEFTEKEEFTKNVQVLEPDTMEVDKEKINITDKYIGYYFENSEPEVIPDTVTNGDVIKVNYVIRKDLKYRIEYYFNGELKEEKTETIENQTYNQKVTEYEDKVEVGYKLEKTENLPLTISVDETQNVIKVYYVTDPNQTKKIVYTVEYYKDGELVDKEDVEEEVQVLAPDVVSLDKSKVNTEKEYEGYYFLNTEPEVIPDTVTNGDVIKVNYAVRKDLSYTVKYIDQVTKEELKPEETRLNQTYNSEVKETAPIIKGFAPVENEKTIIIGIGKNEIIFEYTTRNDLSYKVEYYFNNEISEEKTDVFENQRYNTKITEYADKVEVGYKLEKTENLPLTISENEENNVIKVFYITDDTQTKVLKYTVEYYKNKTLADSEEFTKEVQVLEPETMVVDKEKINTKDKYEGYNFLKTEPEEIPAEVVNGDVIKVYYMPKAEYSYTIKYIDVETGFELKEPETKENQVYDSEVTEVAPEIPGYTARENEKNIKITSGMNEIIFEYEMKSEIEYTVEYYYENVLNEELTEVHTGKYNEKIEEYEDKVLVGYKLEKTENLPLTISDDPEENVIKVYYKIDETQQKDLSYTVKYFKLDEEVTEDNQLINKLVQAAKPDELEVDKSQINVEDKYFGYKVSQIKINDEIVEELPDKVKNGDIIQIIYVIDESATKELQYNVEYYKDGVKAEIEENKYSVQVLEPDTLVVDKTKINVTDKYIGYKFEKFDTETIPDVVTSGDTIKVYYVRQDYEYKVEYYYNGVLKEENTSVKTAKYQDIIDSYEDKIIEGYIVEDVKNLPLTISELKENNVIKVYYAKETFRYTINYYYEGIKDEENTVNLRGKFGEVINEYPDKVKAGYELDRVENLPLSITEDMNKNIINVYYKLKDSQIEVRYVDKYTKEDILEREIITGKVFGDYDLSQNQKEIPGYTLVGGPQNLNVKFEEDKVIYIFSYAKNSEVVVKYLEKDDTPENEDNKVLAEEEVIPGYENQEYETVQKEIENYSFVEVVGNKTGAFARENIEVIYFYAQNTKVVVNHIDKVTEEIMETVEYTGKVGDSYQAEAKNFENYVLTERPENEIGVMTKEVITVNYYYNHVSSGVIEKHIDLMSNEILVNALHEGVEGTEYSIKEKEFEGYEIATNIRYYSKYVLENPEFLEENEVASVEELLEKLKLEKDGKYIPENAEGKMSIETLEVSYYYLRKTTVKVEYIDKATKEVIKVNDKDSTVIIEGLEGDTYKTELKEFDGYEIAKDPDGNPIHPGNAEGKMQVTIDENGNVKTETNVRYYYEKLGKVVEKHIDIVTGKVIEEKTHYGAVGKDYKVEAKELEGFEIVNNRRYYEKLVLDNPNILKENDVTTVDELLDKLQINSKNNYIPENAEGKMTEEGTEVKYYYIRKIKVVVRYIDKNTGETIKTRYMENGLIQEKDPTVIFEGYEGDSYKAASREFEHYILIQEEYPINETGKMVPTVKEDGTVENTMYVTYYYARKTANIKVEYVDSITGEVIKTSDNYTNNEGEEYKVEPKQIDGYDVIIERIPSNASGTLYEEGVTVRYYYIKKAKVIVRYLDVKTNEAIEQETVINGHEGDSYTTQEKVINGYSLNNIAGKTTGNMTREDIIVTYYYDKKEEPKQETPNTPDSSEQNKEQNSGETSNDTKPNQTGNTITPSVTIKPSENTNNKDEVIKTGDVGPNIYISIITIIILANIIQIAFTNKKTKVIK